ncbi:MAG TPA: single-stranded-DNA-specific exonuclease RecJ [Clostridiaceae bacterium]|nr:single-stranded-DNA-specific exonuclease RecJ [Clostridiaceae bacterium]
MQFEETEGEALWIPHDKYWVSNEAPAEEVDEISRNLGISRLLAKVLLSRGIKDPDYIKDFINPSPDDFHDPFLLKDMDKAVDRIWKAIQNKEKIIIYGDYDVDGTTSTSVLMDYLRDIGDDVDYYIPDRIEEGYGLSIEAMDKIAGTGATLIITVDCGITAVEEIAYARSKGIDVIVTDHHECKSEIPEAIAVIDPWRQDCSYPFKELAGVGIVLKLINAMNIRYGIGKNFIDYMELVALGTIADVSKITGENRVIAKFGMEKMSSSSNIGLRKLIEKSGLEGKTINTYSVGFIIAPRINAAGRIGDAGRIVNLFTGDREEEAEKIALELNEENSRRQETEQLILQEAFDIIESDPEYLDDKVLVVAGTGWHKGVVGIVSSRITEKYYRPSILISIEEGMGKGSGRSIEGFNLFKALTHCQHLLDKYGGHELAAGLTLPEENIQLFRKAINEYADLVMQDEDLIPRIKVDAYINDEDITLENIKELDKLAPFGTGNPSPVFACNDIIISSIRSVGKGKHLKLVLKIGDIFIDAIGFNMGDLAEAYNSGDVVDVAFSLEVNEWNNMEKAQLVLKDIRPCARKSLINAFYYKLDKDVENSRLLKYNIDISLDLRNMPVDLKGITLNRKELEAIYQYIKNAALKEDSGKYTGRDIRVDNLITFASKISKTYGISINFFKLKRAMDIFEELNLLRKTPLGKLGMYIVLEKNNTKKNLENSKTYMRCQEIINKLSNKST